MICFVHGVLNNCFPENFFHCRYISLMVDKSKGDNPHELQDAESGGSGNTGRNGKVLNIIKYN